MEDISGSDPSPLRFGTSWRCGNGLFFEVPPPLESDALLTTLHPHLENANGVMR
jgi:hypothetical protein